MEQLRQLVVALVGREEVGCAVGSGEGTIDDKVEEGDERDARESSPQQGFLMVTNLNGYFSSMFNREDISSLPFPDAKFQEAKSDYLGQLIKQRQ